MSEDDTPRTVAKPTRIVLAWVIPITMLILTAASIAVMVAVSRKPQKHVVAFATGHLSLMDSSPDLLDRVVVMLGRDTILALAKTTYEFLNTGDVPILESDFEVQPFVKIPEYVDYFTLEVTARSPRGPKAEVSTDTLNRTATLGLGLLNPGEWVTADLIMAVRARSLGEDDWTREHMGTVSRYLSSDGRGVDAIPAFSARIVGAELRFTNVCESGARTANDNAKQGSWLESEAFSWVFRAVVFVVCIGCWVLLWLHLRSWVRDNRQTLALLDAVERLPEGTFGDTADADLVKRLRKAINQSLREEDLTRGVASTLLLVEARERKVYYISVTLTLITVGALSTWGIITLIVNLATP